MPIKFFKEIYPLLIFKNLKATLMNIIGIKFCWFQSSWHFEFKQKTSIFNSVFVFLSPQQYSEFVKFCWSWTEYSAKKKGLNFTSSLMQLFLLPPAWFPQRLEYSRRPFHWLSFLLHDFFNKWCVYTSCNPRPLLTVNYLHTAVRFCRDNIWTRPQGE